MEGISIVKERANKPPLLVLRWNTQESKRSERRKKTHAHISNGKNLQQNSLYVREEV